LGLDRQREVELVDRGGYLELAPVATPMQLEQRDGVPVAVAGTPLPTLSADQVRAALEAVRP
ncbi:MAG TPA: hypothetical protein VGA36_04665, partial [Nitriliruptorales bacterium]